MDQALKRPNGWHKFIKSFRSFVNLTSSSSSFSFFFSSASSFTSSSSMDLGSVRKELKSLTADAKRWPPDASSCEKSDRDPLNRFNQISQPKQVSWLQSHPPLSWWSSYSSWITNALTEHGTRLANDYSGDGRRELFIGQLAQRSEFDAYIGQWFITVKNPQIHKSSLACLHFLQRDLIDVKCFTERTNTSQYWDERTWTMENLAINPDWVLN